MAERERTVRTLYPETAGNDIDRLHGYPHGTSNAIARRLVLKHSPEFIARRKERMAAAMVERRKYAYTPEATAKRMSTRAKNRRMEENRIWLGLPRRHNYRFAAMPSRCYKAKLRLVDRYGYVQDKGDPYLLAVVEDTRRRPETGRGSERYYTELYGLRFTDRRPKPETDGEDAADNGSGIDTAGRPARAAEASLAPHKARLGARRDASREGRASCRTSTATWQNGTTSTRVTATAAPPYGAASSGSRKWK